MRAIAKVIQAATAVAVATVSIVIVIIICRRHFKTPDKPLAILATMRQLRANAFLRIIV